MNLPPAFHFLRIGWWIVHVVAVAAVSVAGFVAGAHGAANAGHADHGGAAPASASGAPNAVQAEMRLLEGALARGVSLFAAGDLRPLEHELHAVHAAKEKTHEAVERGAYRLPKNADRLARFEQLDGDFHRTLEELAEQAAKNDLALASAAFGRVLGACNGCHAEFR